MPRRILMCISSCFRNTFVVTGNKYSHFLIYHSHMLGVVDYTILFENFSLLFYHFSGHLTCVKVALLFNFCVFKNFSYLYLIILAISKTSQTSISIAVYERKWNRGEKISKVKIMTHTTNIKWTMSEILLNLLLTRESVIVTTSPKENLRTIGM